MSAEGAERAESLTRPGGSRRRPLACSSAPGPAPPPLILGVHRPGTPAGGHGSIHCSFQLHRIASCAHAGGAAGRGRNRGRGSSRPPPCVPRPARLWAFRKARHGREREGRRRQLGSEDRRGEREEEASKRTEEQPVWGPSAPEPYQKGAPSPIPPQILTGSQSTLGTVLGGAGAGSLVSSSNPASPNPAARQDERGRLQRGRRGCPDLLGGPRGLGGVPGKASKEGVGRAEKRFRLSHGHIEAAQRGGECDGRGAKHSS